MTLHHTTPLDYTNMEYLGSIGNPEDLFLTEVMFAGLGAIMDVAVTLAASMEELIRKKPNISMKALFRSGREVGYHFEFKVFIPRVGNDGGRNDRMSTLCSSICLRNCNSDREKRS